MNNIVKQIFELHANTYRRISWALYIPCILLIIIIFIYFYIYIYIFIKKNFIFIYLLYLYIYFNNYFSQTNKDRGGMPGG